MCDPYTRKPRGFGFITYDATAAVDRACVNKFHELNGKRVEVKRAIPQDRISAEDAANHGMRHGDQFGMGGHMHGGMRGGPYMGGQMRPGMARPHPNKNHGYIGGVGGMGMGSHADSCALDTAVSAAATVLSSATLAEPNIDTPPIPAGILSAFSNGSSFSSASAALSTGMRADYGGVRPDGPGVPTSGQMPPLPQSPPGSSGNGAGPMQMLASAQQHQSQSQQVQLQTALLQMQQQQQQQQLQMQQQQLLIHQMQQQSQVSTMKQLKELQMQLQSNGPGGEGKHDGDVPSDSKDAKEFIEQSMDRLTIDGADVGASSRPTFGWRDGCARPPCHLPTLPPCPPLSCPHPLTACASGCRYPGAGASLVDFPGSGSPAATAPAFVS
jgi:hypothetical protein